MSIRILHGDCRDMLKTLPDASVDSIVTDPPYHLTNTKGGTGGGNRGFMGLKWDGGDIAQDPAVWAECLRVLKPGGYLLAFSGTRTQHRMVCAIEDAGFEIRDQIGWVFASGFPKSHNLDNQRGKAICGCEPPPERGLHPVSDADVQTAEPIGSRCGALLQQGLPQQSAPASGRTKLSAAEVWCEQPGLEGRGDGLQEEGQLRERPLRAGAGLGAADGSSGWLRDGTPADDGRVVRPPADADGSGASHQPRPGAQRQVQLGTLAGQPKPQTRGAWPVCGGCGKPILPKGLGTALKPATEPICVARKPLDGTVIANVLKHGTGALNIDGCRVGTESTTREKAGGRNQFPHEDDAWVPKTVMAGSDIGRWPANLIHDGSDEVVAAFPDAPGAMSPVTGNEPSSSTSSVYGKFTRAASDRTGEASANSDNLGAVGFKMKPGARRETTSAARFFYCAKADRADRNEGLQGMPTKDLNWSSGTQAPGTFKSANTNRAVQNHHPTVKPTDLMRYLCRLVTPKGGVVLDPFMGSGSTLKAAELEGFSAIGIELSAEYIDIARRRIGADAPLFAEVTT